MGLCFLCRPRTSRKRTVWILTAENITGGAHKEDQQDPHRQQDSHSKSEIQNLKSSVSNIHEEMKGMSEIIKQNAVADNSYVNIERQYQTESGATSFLEARIVAGEEKLHHKLLEKIDERISDLRTQMDMGIRSIQSIQKPRMVDGDTMLNPPDKSNGTKHSC